jgi:hypothetical protein
MSTKHTLPRGTPYDERAVILARRLIADLPSSLNPPTSEKQWMILWASIGQELAEKEPEFLWGPGRRPSNRSYSLSPNKDAIRQRRHREGKIKRDNR